MYSTMEEKKKEPKALLSKLFSHSNPGVLYVCLKMVYVTFTCQLEPIMDAAAAAVD